MLCHVVEGETRVYRADLPHPSWVTKGTSPIFSVLAALLSMLDDTCLTYKVLQELHLL